MKSKHHRVTSGSPYEAKVGFSRGVRHGKHIVVSGTAPIWSDGHVSPDVGTQARRCWEIALAAVTELGGTVEDVILTRHYITDVDDVEVIAEVHGEVFGEVRPASTIVVVAGLVDARWKVEVELEAYVDDKH